MLFLIDLVLAFPRINNVATLDYGTFKGRISSSLKSVSYFAIPFAAPPLGELRFQPPQPPLNRSGQVIDATKPGPACMVDTSELIDIDATASEDCLQLNVFAPSTASPGDNLPVLVYVYGGAFTSGHSTMPWGAGARNLVRKGKVVVVTMNYRLGAFGFMPSVELRNQNSANLGILDVAEAFKWVRKHIHAFGGNPRQVTGFGISAGGVILGSLLMAKDGTLDLFDRVFLQSGAYVPVLDTPERLSFVMDLIYQNTGCNNLDCLTKIDAKKLLSASINTDKIMSAPVTAFGPIIDGSFISRQQSESLDLGLFRKIPTMINTNLDEGMYFVVTHGINDGPASQGYRNRLLPYMNETEYAKLDSLYSAEKSSLPFYNVSTILSDYYFHCPSRKVAKSMSKYAPVTKTFLRHQPDLLQLPGFPKLGVCHGADIPFWWDFKIVMPRKEERELTDLMVKSFIDFASCPDPNNCPIGKTDKSPEWPKYPHGRIDLDIPLERITTNSDDEFDAKCEFFEKAIEARHGDLTGAAHPPKQPQQMLKKDPLKELFVKFKEVLRDH